MINDPLVKMEHVREAGLCSRGARQWFTLNKLDYMLFLTKGLPCSVVEATGDALGLQVVAIARASAEDER